MKQGMENIKAVKWQEGINLENFSRDNIFDSIQEIDRSVFHENGLSDKQSDIDRYEAYKDSYIFALDDNKIIGYFCYFPITEEFYKSIIEGIKVYDGDIASSDICNLNNNSNYIFLLSAAILPDYQKKGISRQFSEIFMEEISRIKIREIVSYAFTEGGERLLNILGLKKYKDMEDGIKLMKTNNDNFDLILAIPCGTVKNRKIKPKNKLNIKSIASSYLEDIPQSYLEKTARSFLKSIDSTVKCGEKEMVVKNDVYANKSNLPELAGIFCRQIEEHGEYELIFNDRKNKIRTKRAPLLFGQIILYKDEKYSKFIPECCYNFFCVVSELTINKDTSSGNNVFNIIYFVVPDINYSDLTLLMDQSFELWCNIRKNSDSHVFITKYLDKIGYKFFGKIYRIVFSDLNQYKMIMEGEDNKARFFNILAAETYKERFSHQIELSKNTSEFSLSSRGNTREIILSKKEKFYDDYNMYRSYKAFASLYSYYYVINKEGKDIFRKRIEPDETDEGFSSEGNILFVLETEIFKISAGLALSNTINDQINNPNMREIQEMFKGFINTRPLFEKLTYCYLGAQKEADFIYQQFRIGDILTDYDRKRELLKSYCEVTSSIIENNNSKILNCIGLLFTFIAGFELLSKLSHNIFDDEKTVIWNIDFIIPVIVFIIIIGIMIKIIGPVKYLKRLFKRRPGRSLR
ncbi:MAG: GNAT family N-acetyltransferase [Treponema sp.]|jgi:GNAT superfamily N-acetyltransferase|nr:GNAT family N-acetyltransferase [Treponema sp.]